ncbi:MULTISPECIES: zinc-dependent alcohol dehydrogenase [Sphingomonadaceae]|uniref:alcohol dehydrogenase n=1 Tax=Novosphingobium clariflavum TaxID=2029884 RepID=A0ABV6S7Z7_9SPHN|nr:MULTISPECIES: zinc-dependent alcohol dehydrogenase [Sphingomonadaceae]QDK31488.1 zinc-dependent alcohol dehydrogenase [Sphingomonas sp. IC081]QSR16239.1 zinc-dependent alcohol dehydrogenase [Novosphingobium sp. KA1]
MQTMRAAVAREYGAPLTIEQVPIPTPGPGEVLVKVVASGVCHTDLHAIDGDWPVKAPLPLIPGHEGVGHVVALGAGVTDLKEGDAVGVPWLHHACRECEYCETGWETLCEKQANTGYSVNGGYAEYVIAAAPFVGRLPADVDFVSMAPILCAGVTVYKGLKETEARPGQWVVCSGVGGLGHVAVQYAKAMGLNVIGIDIGESKLKLARELGAELAFDATDPDLVAKVQKETGGGAHGVIVTAVSRAAFSQAIACARRRATVSLIGLPPGDFPTPIFDVVLKRITIRGSIVGTRYDLDEAIAFAAQGKVKAKVAARPLEEVNEVLDDLRHGRIDGRVALTL